MKGKVENTISQRQYENIKTTYYFENEEERKQAIERSIQDCLDYSHIVHTKAEERKAQAQPKPDNPIIKGHGKTPLPEGTKAETWK